MADDIKLGLLLRRSGVRQGCIDSGGLVQVRWQNGFVASMRGLIKNFFAGLEYDWPRTLRSLVELFAATALAPACLLVNLMVGGPLSISLLAAAATAVPVSLHALHVRRMARGHGAEALAFPLMGVCLAAVSLTSALAATFRQAVIWRGTRYPLQALRAACVRDKDVSPALAPGPATRG